MQDFPANSRKARAQPEGPPPDERPKLERVTSAEAVRRKKGIGRQFKETFIEGSARTALEYMVGEVVVPSVRDMMAEAVHAVTDRVIYGDSPSRLRRHTTPPTYSNVGHVNYQRMSTPAAKPAPPRMLSRQSRTRQNFGEIVIASRVEADEVIERLFDLLSRYGSASVADLYELTGIASSHTDHKWGWHELRGAKAVRLRDGNFLLDLPEPEVLD
jgi:hypothetical protein